MSVFHRREALAARLFPEGIPSLWCPPLVHYDASGRIDHGRIEAHLSMLCRNVRAFLLFGSTGDGWELSAAEKEELLSLYIRLADGLGFQMLLGVLEPERGRSAEKIGEWLRWLGERFGTADPILAMERAHICGFTVCAPRGGSLSQAEIEDDLRAVLRIGVPVALYQLPQITLNEISPAVVGALAREYFNFFLFKDTSGTDRAVQSGEDFGHVFLVRGAEGGYEKWAAASGGPYDGFLLSSVNCFSAELRQLLELLHSGDSLRAQELARRVAAVMDEVFANAGGLPGGNVFTNANKCVDHILAHGGGWRSVPAPTLHCGDSIPLSCLESAARSLQAHGWRMGTGYLH